MVNMSLVINNCGSALCLLFLSFNLHIARPYFIIYYQFKEHSVSYSSESTIPFMYVEV